LGDPGVFENWSAITQVTPPFDQHQVTPSFLIDMKSYQLIPRFDWLFCSHMTRYLHKLFGVWFFFINSYCFSSYGFNLRSSVKWLTCVFDVGFSGLRLFILDKVIWTFRTKFGIYDGFIEFFLLCFYIGTFLVFYILVR